MTRLLFSAVAASAALHAAVVAFVLLPARNEATRAISVEVAWVAEAESSSSSPSLPASRSRPAPGLVEAVDMPLSHPTHSRLMPPDLIRGPSSAPADRDTESRGEVAAGLPDHVRGQQTVDRTKAIESAPPETVPSRERRQPVASRAANSRGPESPRTPSMPATAAAKTVSAQESDGGLASLARSGESESSPANSMAAGSEIVYRVAPTYPVAARRRGIEGAVLLHVRFDAAGRPEEISVLTSSGSAMLDEAAREAVARWRFRGGAAGALELPITFRFADAGSGGASSIQ